MSTAKLDYSNNECKQWPDTLVLLKKHKGERDRTHRRNHVQMLFIKDPIEGHMIPLNDYQAMAFWPARRRNQNQRSAGPSWAGCLLGLKLSTLFWRYCGHATCTFLYPAAALGLAVDRFFLWHSNAWIQLQGTHQAQQKNGSQKAPFRLDQVQVPQSHSSKAEVNREGHIASGIIGEVPHAVKVAAVRSIQ